MKVRVHILYKRLEIPANKVIPAIAVSVTYRTHEKAENTGSIPVSATNSFIIIYLRNFCTGLALQAGLKGRGQGWNPDRHPALSILLDVMR